MKITNIVFKNKKYQVSFDNNKHLLTEDVLIKFNLKVGQDVSTFEYNTILEVDKYFVTLNKMILSLAKQPKTKHQVIQCLLKNRIFDTSQYVSTLTELGLIDDKKFAKQFFYECVNYDKYGLYKIESKMISLGISKDDYEFIYNEYSYDDEYDNGLSFIDKELQLENTVSYNKFIQKLETKLYNYGFRKSMIRELLIDKKEELVLKDKDEEFIIRDIEKYKDLDNNKLKRKLYSLGYLEDDIELSVR